MTINFISLNSINEELSKYSTSSLLIVTKKQSIEDIQNLIDLGYKHYGENRVQEALKKYPLLSEKKKINLHLIGPLQSNKAKLALTNFDIIQTIDRISLVDEIHKIIQNTSYKIKTREFYIQVNIGDEKQKSGVNKKEVYSFFQYCLEKKINVTGLMCIPPNIADTSSYYEEMNIIKNKISNSLKLSMGMSSDYKIALKFNSNIIRVGSLIFN